MYFYSVFTQILDLSNAKVEKWTVIAAFVTEDGKVLSVASGVKCLPINKLFTPDGEKLPCYHDFIRDSHAEVLARRALIRYCLVNPSQIPQKVWLFTTQVPCGDASIVAEPGAQVTVGLERGKSDWRKVGCLRTKPGRGDAPPTHCLSCSDKILKWLHLGVQGKYLHSRIDLCGIVIAGNVNRDSVERALLKRCPPPNSFEIVLLKDVSVEETAEPSFDAKVWHLGLDKVETLIQGRKQGSKKSPLNCRLPQSSRSLFCDSSLQALQTENINTTYEESKRVLFADSPLLQHWPRVTGHLPESLLSIANRSPHEPADGSLQKRPRTH